jgi:hypothetical protein
MQRGLGAVEDLRAGVVGRLRARRREIEGAIFTRVRDTVADPVGDSDMEYVAGLRATVVAAVDYVLAGLERGQRLPGVPREAVLQARRAARHGVGLEAVLRRYMVGQAVLSDYILQEANRVELAGAGIGGSRGEGVDGSRELLRVQAALADRMVAEVAREHVEELQRVGRSREHRRRERIRALLAGDSHAGEDRAGEDRGDGGEDADGHGGEGAQADGQAGGGGFDRVLGYDLGGEHLGVIARGEGAQEALRELAAGLDRQLLCVVQERGTVWAWLGGQRALGMSDLERAVAALGGRVPGRRRRRGDRDRDPSGAVAGVCLAAGEPARGLTGWRLTHQQAQAALVVALQSPRTLTRYGDVALLASALKDERLARALVEIYLLPLEDGREGGQVLRETLRAYLAAERNVSSASAALGVVRKTVENRLRTIEERLGRTLHPCPAELEVALQLDDLGYHVNISDAAQ